MKKIILTASALLLASGVFANTEENSADLTLAAANIAVNTTWVETLEDAQIRIDDELTEKADELNAKLGEKLQAQIESKMTQALSF